MKRAVIVSTARTGLAKFHRGAFDETHGATMAGHRRFADQRRRARLGVVTMCIGGDGGAARLFEVF